MAHADNSIITGKFQGLLGGELVFRDWEGKTVVAKAPKGRTGDPTPQQEELQEKFLLASRYATAIVKGQDQSMADAYATMLRPRQNVYSRALEDFLTAPVVKSIDGRKYKGAIGDLITVRAVDDFRVTGVQVNISAPDGTLIERGDAQQSFNGLDWTYTVKQVNNVLAGSKITALATDVPGNEGALEVIL